MANPGSQQQGRGQEEVVAAEDPYVDAGDHHHQEHEPRPEEHGSDDGEARERREIRIEVELDKEPGERGEKDRERGGENEPYRRVRLEYAFPEALQEVPGDPHLGGDDDADPDQRHPRVRLLEQVERLEPRPVARVYDPLGDDAFDQGPRSYTYERRQREPGQGGKPDVEPDLRDPLDPGPEELEACRRAVEFIDTPARLFLEASLPDFHGRSRP